MEDLRGRFRRLVSTHTDALRHLEHSTFNRLIYRNRQQHRHGLYFQRLEHVRRLLHKIMSHVAWNSVQHALGEEDCRVRSKKKAPLSLSSVTVHDLQSVEALLKVLVGQVIPATAARVTTELICRQHFIPFAVAIVACLARIFVVERKLVAEIRGAIVEAKLLLGISNDKRGWQQQTVRTEGSIEDVGEEVKPADAGMQAANNVGHKAECEGVSGKRETSGRARIYETQSALLRPLKRRRIPVDKGSANTNEKEVPSLYAAMALYDKRVPSLVESTARSAEENLTATRNEILGGAENRHIMDGAARVKAERETLAVESEIADAAQRTLHNSLKSGERDIGVTQLSLGTGACVLATPCQPPGSSSGSDSEDIDDIFKVLDD